MRHVLTALGKVFDMILVGSGLCSAAIMVLLSLFIGIQVIARYLLGMHITGLFDLSSYSLIVFTFLSGAYALKEKRHVAVNILLYRIPERARPGFDAFVQSVALVFTVWLGWSACFWASSSWRSGVETISEVPIPKGILIGTIALGAALLALELLRSVIRNVLQMSRSLASDQHGSVRGWEGATLYGAILAAGLLTSLLVCAKVSILGGLCLLALCLLFSGMPVFLALGLAGSVGLYFIVGPSATRQISFFAYQAVDSFPLTCLPLFIIAGLILEKGQLINKVFRFFQYFAKGNLAAPLVVTILVGGFFCAISGSSVATTSIIAAVTLPILTAQGYSRSLSSGVVAGATIGTVIPPSIGYILYGVITGDSIGQLFVAGIVPGVVIFGFYCLYVLLLAAFRKESLFEGGKLPASPQRERVSFGEKARIFRGALWGLIAPIFVLGGIYLGVFTPSEAAAVMVLYAIGVTVVLMRAVRMKELFQCVLTGVGISSMILLIIVGARIFGAVTSQLRVAADLVAFANEAALSPLTVLVLVTLLLFIFGMFLDSASIMVITLPVLHPLIAHAGFDSLWFGVFFIVVLEIGLLTPPVGLNMFLIYGISGFELKDVIKGSVPFMLLMLLSLFLFVIFPQVVTWLPGTMRG